MKSKIIVLIIVLLCVASCENKNPNPCPNQNNCFGVYMDNVLVLQYRDKNNVDLLNPDNIGHYDIDSIKIYYLAPDGCVVYYYNEMVKLTDPDNRISYRGFDIQYSNQGYFFGLDVRGIGAAYHKHGNKEVYWGLNNDTYAPRTVYIQFNENDTDTVNANLEHLSGNMLSQNPGGYCTYDVYGEIRYNGKLIVSSWEDNLQKMSQGIYPTIIKE